MQKTVLHFITGLESGGGAETFLSRLLPMLDDSEFRHVVCSMLPPGEIGGELIVAGVEVRTLGQHSKFDPRIIGRYRQLLRELKPAMQINYLFHADIFGRIFGPLFSEAKIVSFIRNNYQNWKYTLADKLTLGRADCLLTNNAAVMEYYEANFVLPDCRQVIPNGVLLPEEADVVARDDDSFVITTVARLHPVKNLHTLVEAAAHLADDILGLEVLFVGEGSEEARLKQLADELGVKGHVYFLGKRQDVPYILAASDAFVLPSKEEGMSNALLEAMAHGLPCVVSDIPGNTALIKGSENGLTFECGNAQDLADQLRTLHADSDLRASYGQAARQTVVDSYSLGAAREKIQKFIKEEL